MHQMHKNCTTFVVLLRNNFTGISETRNSARVLGMPRCQCSLGVGITAHIYFGEHLFSSCIFVGLCIYYFLCTYLYNVGYFVLFKHFCVYTLIFYLQYLSLCILYSTAYEFLHTVLLFIDVFMWVI